MKKSTQRRRSVRPLFLLVTACWLAWCISCARKENALETGAPERGQEALEQEIPQAAIVAGEIPEFPWPPPKATGTQEIPREYLTKQIPGVTRLGHVERQLHAALQSCGYYEKSYYAVPDGFAMVTRLEQINSDGTPKEGLDRWARQVPRPRTLREYFTGLFKTRPGYYRVIVFIVTPHPFSQTDVNVSREDADAWLHDGLNRLPGPIGAREYSEEYACTALIYEFVQPDTDETAQLRSPGLPGRTHLEKAKLWEALTS